MDEGTTRDGFLGGRLVLRQPARGHRCGTDAALLAAAAPPGFGGLCYDMGAGVGAVGLGIALLRPGARLVLVEREPGTAALARANASGLPAEVAECDILDRAALRRALPERAALVVSNPPFFEAAGSRASPDPLRRAAHVLGDGATTQDWLAACLDRLDNKGTLLLIHRAAALPAILLALGHRVGAVAVRPVLPREGRPARRVLVRALKGSRAPFALLAPLVLHGADGRMTPEADRLHRGAATLDW